MSRDDHSRTINREFSSQAGHFDTPGLTLSNKDLLAWIVSHLCLAPHFRVLDVAAGTCLLTRNVAPHVAHVTSLDATEAMLERGKEEIAKEGHGNIETRLGQAEALPFADNSFDLVMSRLALHHFQDWRPPFAEMVRVAKTGGLVGVADLLSPDDPALKEPYNHLERLRDPSHVTALTGADLADLLHRHGLAVCDQDTRTVEVDFDKWLSMAGGSKIPGHREALLQALEGELEGGPATGMRPFRRDGRLMFLQTWTVVAARRQA